MSDAAAPAASPKKTAAKAKKPAKPKTPATHPPVAEMVTAAVKALKDRKGSSLPAIKKYINANYKCDAAKLAPFIKKFLRNAVTSGKLVQVKGTGASGSFKLSVPAKADKPKVAKTPAAKAKKPAKKPAVKKTKPAKKSPAKAKKPKAAAKPKKAKSPAKPKKAKKSPAKKPAAKKPAKKTAKKAAKK